MDPPAAVRSGGQGGVETCRSMDGGELRRVTMAAVAPSGEEDGQRRGKHGVTTMQEAKENEAFAAEIAAGMPMGQLLAQKQATTAAGAAGASAGAAAQVSIKKGAEQQRLAPSAEEGQPPDEAAADSRSSLYAAVHTELSRNPHVLLAWHDAFVDAEAKVASGWSPERGWPGTMLCSSADRIVIGKVNGSMTIKWSAGGPPWACDQCGCQDWYGQAQVCFGPVGHVHYGYDLTDKWAFACGQSGKCLRWDFLDGPDMDRRIESAPPPSEFGNGCTFAKHGLDNAPKGVGVLPALLAQFPQLCQARQRLAFASGVLDGRPDGSESSAPASPLQRLGYDVLVHVCATLPLPRMEFAVRAYVEHQG